MAGSRWTSSSPASASCSWPPTATRASTRSQAPETVSAVQPTTGSVRSQSAVELAAIIGNRHCQRPKLQVRSTANAAWRTKRPDRFVSVEKVNTFEARSVPSVPCHPTAHRTTSTISRPGIPTFLGARMYRLLPRSLSRRSIPSTRRPSPSSGTADPWCSSAGRWLF
jgi:hypothetical protein